MRRLPAIVRALLLFAVLMACMLGGIFAAAGVSAFAFSSSVLDTVLGNPPDRTHPAFWVFIIVMVPGMLVGAAGAMFGVILPVAARWPVAGIPGAMHNRRLLRAYVSWIGRLVPDEQAGGPAAG